MSYAEAGKKVLLDIPSQIVASGTDVLQLRFRELVRPVGEQLEQQSPNSKTNRHPSRLDFQDRPILKEDYDRRLENRRELGIRAGREVNIRKESSNYLRSSS